MRTETFEHFDVERLQSMCAVRREHQQTEIVFSCLNDNISISHMARMPVQRSVTMAEDMPLVEPQT